MTAPPPDPAKLLPLHPLELRILLAVLDGPAHGYRIVKEVEALEGGRFRLYPANLYRRIRDLAGQEFIVEVDPPESEGETDRTRTYFGITPLGHEVVRAEVRRLEELVHDARSTLKPA